MLIADEEFLKEVKDKDNNKLKRRREQEISRNCSGKKVLDEKKLRWVWRCIYRVFRNVLRDYKHL